MSLTKYGPNLGLFDNSVTQDISLLGILERPVAKSFQEPSMLFEPPSLPDSEFKLPFFVECVICQL